MTRAIAAWFGEQLGDAFPRRLAVGARLQQVLRYGENPHQQAALYISGEARPGVATARQLQGKELSFNNINDTDAAYELVAEFKRTGGGDHQARQSLRRGHGGRSADRLSSRRWPAIRSAPSAASSR